MADQLIPTCPHCGFAEHPVTQCWRIKAVEFHRDGSIKRVEYRDPPQLPPDPDAFVIKAEGVGHDV